MNDNYHFDEFRDWCEDHGIAITDEETAAWRLYWECWKTAVDTMLDVEIEIGM